MELLIAGVVLCVGLLAVVALFATAIGSNGRSRVDSTATMISQAVLEQISAKLVGGGPAQVIDCANQTYMIDYAAGGANLSGTGIDFTQNPSSIAASRAAEGYQMNYTACNGGGEANTTAIYDVRWNIKALGAPGQVQTWLVTVAAQPKSMTAGRFTFALPVTMRTYVGQ